MRSARWMGVLIALPCIIISFQNCSTGTSIESHRNASSNVDTPEIPPGAPSSVPPGSSTNPTASFKAGDPYAEDRLPIRPDLSFKRQLLGYLLASTPKALALAQNGRGAVIYPTPLRPIATQAEANRVALEACQAISGGEACVIFAEGLRIKYDAGPQFEAAFTKPLATNTIGFDPLKVPFIPESLRSRAIGYANATGYRAMALNHYGIMVWTTSDLSEADAEKVALERCEGMSRGEPCTTYALGTFIVFNQNSHRLSSINKLNFGSSSFSLARIPFMVESQKRSFASYGDRVSSSPGAIAISAFGRWGVSYDRTQSQAQNSALALEQCRSRNGALDRDYPCFLYAVGNSVNFTRQSLGP